eukprot:m.366436 g.366436  ORF g.366436 m.366436 type:complete len:67 (-) comp56068_c1_seq9:1688-1888(-)
MYFPILFVSILVGVGSFCFIRDEIPLGALSVDVTAKFCWGGLEALLKTLTRNSCDSTTTRTCTRSR